MENIIEFKNTNFAYNNVNSFNDFNMEIATGDIVTLIGPSGSGKTTLLKMLCHQLPNDTCYYKGVKFSSCEVELLKKEVVVIFDTAFNCKTAKEEIIQYLYKLGLDESEIEERYEKICEKFKLQGIDEINPHTLAYKDAYLIKILRYLIIIPSFIAIDCILSNLSLEDKKRVFDFIKENKITLLNVTTDLNDSLYGNKLFVIENFVLILEGSVLSVLKTDTLLKRLGFELPLEVDLSIELNHYEVLDKVYTDRDKLVKELWK